MSDDPEEALFRSTVRRWLEANAAATKSTERKVPPPLGERVAEARAWQRRLYDSGWAGITWPKQYGGRGGTPIQAAIFQEEEARVVTVLKPFNPAIGDAGPQIMTHGTQAQKDAYLLPILRGEQVWCHLLSEPDAGSDLASVSTKAVRDGDTFVINGQKVWTSYAHYADFGLLLARTNLNVPKHSGLSYLIVDMALPGITVRPILEITGESSFNEVVFDDVRVPSVNVIGEVDHGWTVTRHTMVNERSYVAGGIAIVDNFRLLGALAEKRGLSAEHTIHDRLAQCYTRQQLLRFLRYRVLTSLSHGEAPGPAAAVLKLVASRHGIATANDAMAVLGPDGLQSSGEWQRRFLASPAATIGGGTDHMQLNMIGERILGLPR